MPLIRLLYRLLGFGAHLLLGAILCVLFLRDTKGKPMSDTQRAIVRWWLRWCCRIAGLRIHSDTQTQANACLVANHVSWLDIIIIGGLHSARFLSKAEIRRWPVIGYLAACAGTLFINRGSGAKVALEDIQATLEQNENIALFPEGTTSKDYTVRPFHSRLLRAPIDAGVAVQPIALAFPENGRPNTHILFTARQNFFTNVLRVLMRRRTRVEVRHLEPIRDTDCKAVAGRARDAIVQALEGMYASSP